MTRPLLEDAFGHHVWATLQLLDSCAHLTADQLATSISGTYGSIIDTLRHLVGADSSYLFVLSGGLTPVVYDAGMDVAELRTVMERNREGWSSVVKKDLDPDAIVVRHRDDGSESHAPVGIRLAQVLHHGTDHRSQVCTALTMIGVEPPAIDVWDFAKSQGRLLEVPPSA